MKHMLIAILLGVMGMSVHAAEKHRIFFNRVGPVRAQLFVANGDGTAERALLPLTGLDYSPSLSADEQWVVFTSERNGSADLFRMRLDGSGLQQLTNDPAYDDQAVFSPDGKHIAFVSSRGDGRAHLWIMDVASQRARQLTQGTGGDFRPAWSPDGQWIAFTSDRNSHPREFPLAGNTCSPRNCSWCVQMARTCVG